MTSKAREKKAKAKAETVERERAWAKDKENEKAEINRVDVEAMKWARVEAKARVREKSNAVHRASVEARRVQGINPMLRGGWQ